MAFDPMISFLESLKKRFEDREAAPVGSFLPKWFASNDLSRVGQLQLFAKNVVEGVRGGMHRSKHTGASIDFKEHRPYVAGDEIRSIDWKVFGKTDRLYIRQYEDETNLSCHLLIDQSGSMEYSGTRARGLTKYEYAIRLASCFAYLLISQQDAVGLATFDNQVRRYIPPKNQPHHLHPIFDAMLATRPAGESSIVDTIESLLYRLKRAGMVILFSDCFGSVEALSKALGLLRSHRQEVIVFQVLDDDELDFPFQLPVLFRSIEVTDQEKVVDPIQMRNNYLKNLETFQQQVKSKCLQHCVDLVTVRTTQSYSDIVSAYLARRRGKA